jgi:mitofusin
MMVGTKALGLRSVIQAVDLLGNKTVRAWAAPMLMLAVIGGAAWLVIDLPYSIPRTVGRRIAVSLSASTTKVRLSFTTPAPNVGFMGIHAGRVGRETRKVLRLAARDLRERYLATGEETGRAVKEAECVQKRAEVAWAFITGLGERVADVRVVDGLMV